MTKLYCDLIECNIRILNVKFERLHIMGEKLLLSKPPFFFIKKRKEWNKQLDDLYEQEMELQSELIKEYQNLEKSLEKN